MDKENEYKLGENIGGKVAEMCDIIDRIESSPYGISISLLIQLFQKNNELKKLLK